MVEINIFFKIILFCKCRRISLKFVIFCFKVYQLVIKRLKFYHSYRPHSQSALLRSRLNHILALQIFMPQFKSINFCYNRPKIKLFLHKNCKISERWGLRSQTPFPPSVGGVTPKPPMASLGGDCSYLMIIRLLLFFTVYSTYSELWLW